MKWNWGTKIGLFYTLFVVFILVMVYLAFGQKYELVTEDYYAEEIAYQSTIDSKSRAESLLKNLQISIEGRKLIVTFPHDGKAVKGKINCFRPSDESEDFTETFESADGVHSIPLKKFVRGKYRLKIAWSLLSEEAASTASTQKIPNETASSEFYQERIIAIP